MPYDDLFRRYLEPIAPIPTTLSASGRLKEPIRAIVFDIYGTLFVSSSGDIGSVEKTGGPTDALEKLIRTYGLPHSTERLTRKYVDAIRSEHSRMKSLGIDYPEVRVDQIWSWVLGIKDMDMIRRFALSYELIVNPVWPMPHLDQLINACRDAGLMSGIISNAQFYTPLLFKYFCGSLPEHSGFDPELIVYSYAIGRAKPSPVLFDSVVRSLRFREIAPENALYIGNDMRNDIYAAQVAGFQTALFAGDLRSLRLRTDDPCCSGLVPDLCITDLKQLPWHFENPDVL